MIDLRTATHCLTQIKFELDFCKIPQIEVESGNANTFPYSLEGKLGDWTFTRTWGHWIATAPEGRGLPRSAAESLNAEKGWGGYELCREIRVQGVPGGDEVEKWLSPEGTIDVYHIDTMMSLGIFALLLKGELVLV